MKIGCIELGNKQCKFRKHFTVKYGLKNSIYTFIANGGPDSRLSTKHLNFH